ncbi:threonine ammonia-lyase [Halostagnicola kamekurae]|uniref:threonine ammonia-lyase n=1 Tax=Halostagnicola kamekurae TaxID=619731 RepID=A0A1I6UIW2_9EURY|nr:threonine ammonia-lyase [Halostagnicola kamekurae]SFT01406.1 threonine dehydratase [Halostagnicola kamekurae]
MNLSVSAIERARERFDESVVRETPVETSRSLEAKTGAEIRLKMEHLQRTGSFKTRGAYTKLSRIVESGPDVSRVVAASAGNHAQGVALAATELGLSSTVVMPWSAPQTKIDATAAYGADVELHGDDFGAAMEYAQTLVDEDSVFVHAYDDPAIVAGQGTVGLEIVEQVPDVDTIVVPVGGGGLISGIATVISERKPDTRIVGVQAAGAATLPQSLQKGEPVSCDKTRTIADGIATGSLSQITYERIERSVDDVVTVTDTQIADSVLFTLERTKQMIEGASATTIAALRSDRLDVRDELVVPVLSGGNLSMTDLQTVLTHGLTARKQLVRFRVRIVDEPGRLERLSALIADHNANVRNVRHERSVEDLDVGEAYLHFRVETSGTEQTERIVAAIQDAGFPVTRVN